MLNNNGLIPQKLRRLIVLMAGGPDTLDRWLEEMKEDYPPWLVAKWEEDGLFEEMRKEAELERYRNRAAFN